MESNTSSGGDRAPGGKRRRRWLIVLAAGAGIAAVLLLAAFLAVYAERRLIAANFIKQYLTAYGIESEVEFDRLAWGGFLARVRAGSVDAPDFTAEGVDVTLAYPDTSSYVGSVTPQVAAVRLIRPVVRVGYDGEKLSFGSLQRLVDEIMAMESDAPGPEIAIEGARLLLTTPYGAVSLLADVVVDKSKLVRLNGTVERAALKNGGLVAEINGGTITAAMDGEALNAKASLALASLMHEGRTARDVNLGIDGRAIEWALAGDAYKFSARSVVLDVGIGTMDTPELSAARANARLSLQAIEGLSFRTTFPSSRPWAVQRRDGRRPGGWRGSNSCQG